MELSKRVCKKCMKLHVRAYSGKIGRHSSWRDEHGLLWNGKICGACNRERIRDAVNKHRLNKKSENNGTDLPD